VKEKGFALLVLVIIVAILGVVGIVYVGMVYDKKQSKGETEIDNSNVNEVIPAPVENTVPDTAQGVVPDLYPEAEWINLGANYNNYPVLISTSTEDIHESDISLPSINWWDSTISVSGEDEMDKVVRDFMNYYDNSLTSAGWKKEILFDNYKLISTGGANDTALQEGYIYTDGEWVKQILFSWSKKGPVVFPEDGPAYFDCPCSVNLYVTESEFVSLNDILR